MASAGGNDCRDGERTTMAIAAEKNPENLIIHNILAPQKPLLLFLFDLKTKRSGRINDRKIRVPLMSARLVGKENGEGRTIASGKYLESVSF